MSIGAKWAQLLRSRGAEAPPAAEPVHESPPAAETVQEPKPVHKSPPAAETVQEPKPVHKSPPTAEPVQEPKPVHKSPPAAETVAGSNVEMDANDSARNVHEAASSVHVRAQSVLAMLVQKDSLDEEVAGLVAQLQRRLAAAGAHEPASLESAPEPANSASAEAGDSKETKHAHQAIDFAMTQLNQLSERTDLQMAYVRDTALVHLGKLHCCVPDVMVEVDRLLEALSETTATGDVHDTVDVHNTNAESPDVRNPKWRNWADTSEEPLKTEPRANAAGWWPGQPASSWSAQASSWSAQAYSAQGAPAASAPAASAQGART